MVFNSRLSGINDQLRGHGGVDAHDILIGGWIFSILKIGTCRMGTPGEQLVCFLIGSDDFCNGFLTGHRPLVTDKSTVFFRDLIAGFRIVADGVYAVIDGHLHIVSAGYPGGIAGGPVGWIAFVGRISASGNLVAAAVHLANMKHQRILLAIVVRIDGGAAVPGGDDGGDGFVSVVNQREICTVGDTCSLHPFGS